MCIRDRYLRKHNKEYNRDFILGSVLPDLTKDKSKTHYGKSPASVSYTHLLHHQVEWHLAKNLVWISEQM